MKFQDKYESLMKERKVFMDNKDTGLLTQLSGEDPQLKVEQYDKVLRDTLVDYLT